MFASEHRSGLKKQFLAAPSGGTLASEHTSLVTVQAKAAPFRNS
ncbi:hypothetical protein ABIC71_004121 [Herbaspirillum seropedicae]